jgi:hypothetical protein
VSCRWVQLGRGRGRQAELQDDKETIMFSVFRSFQKWRAFYEFNFVKRLTVRMRSVGGCRLSHPERVNGEDRMNLGQIIS